MVMLGCGHDDTPANTPAPAPSGATPAATPAATTPTAPAAAPVVWATFTPSVFARFCWWEPEGGAPADEEGPAR